MMCRDDMNKILATDEQRDRIKQAFGVVNDTVTRALNYKTNTDLSRKIRAYALRIGAKTVNEVMLTLHDSDDRMTQIFSDRVVILTDKTSGDVVLLKDGQPLTEKKNITIPELMKLQERATRLAISLG